MDAEDKLTEKDKKFIVDKAAEGFDSEEIVYLIQQEMDKEITVKPETVEEYLMTDDGSERLKIRKKVREKKADVEKEQLIEELVDLKETLKKRIDHLHEQDLDAISSDQVDNLLKTVDRIGEYIGELDRAGTNANVVKIDKSKTFIQKNFTKVVNHLSKEQKQDIVEQLQDDPEIEDFIIKKRED